MLTMPNISYQNSGLIGFFYKLLFFVCLLCSVNCKFACCRFNTYAEPGPIDNSDFLCPHGGVPPDRIVIVERLTSVIPQVLWEFLHQKYDILFEFNHYT